MSAQNNDTIKKIMEKIEKGGFGNMTIDDIENLKTQINEKGDTIIHWLAENLNVEGLKKLLGNIGEKSSTLLKELVNKQNKSGETPLHKAKETAGNKADEVIKMLTEKFGSNPNIADNKNRIIIKTPLSEKGEYNFSETRKLGNLTEEAKQNIQKLSNMAEEDIHKLIKKIPTDMPYNPDLEKIKELTEHYFGKKTNVGGYPGANSSTLYSGKRKIGGFLSDDITESGIHDSFISKRKSQLMNDMANMISSQDRVRRDPKITEKYNEILKKIMDLLGVDEETARLYRSALKITVGKENPELRKPENDALRVKEVEKLLKDKKTLEKTIKKIDLDEIKKYMKEQKEKSEQRKKEFLERRKERGPKRGPRKEKKPKTESESESTLSETSSSESEPKPKAKRGRKKKEVENGYLQSDEIIFSPGI